jgi:hypothetical protein
MPHLDLSDDEAGAQAQHLHHAIDGDRWPPSPRLAPVNASRSEEMLGQTEIIVHVSGIESDPSVPLTSAQPRFLRIHARTMVGPLDVCISEDAARELMGALGTHLLARYSP